MWQVTHHHPWLTITVPSPITCVGWTLQGGGKVTTCSLLWREVRNEDLPPDLDVSGWLAKQTAGLGLPDAPCFLTSAAISQFEEASATVEGIRAQAVVTAGLGNAERIGQRRSDPKPVGTINAAVIVNAALTDNAALEALSLIAEARTTAMLEVAPKLGPLPVTGTGTDCLALCFQPDGPTLLHTGKHTAIGEAIGAAALAAFSQAIQRWVPPE